MKTLNVILVLFLVQYSLSLLAKDFYVSPKGNDYNIHSKTYHVSKDGDDNNSGTKDSPFRTLAKASVILNPGERFLAPTGIYVEIPPGFEGEIRPRSGLAVKHGIGIVNSPGTIDADYRGEVRVILINWGSEPFVIRRGERIAQLIIKEVCRAELKVKDELTKTGRNTGGFGHTGIS